jgi:hypothetical protein
VEWSAEFLIEEQAMIRFNAKSELAGSLMVAGLAAAILGPAPAFAETSVHVTFVQPEHFTDAGNYQARSRDATLKTLDAQFQTLGARYLKPGQALDVQVLDVDLAGRLEPWRANAYDVRYMRDITWPRIKLSYTLTANGRVLDQREETVSDMNYLMRANGYFSDDKLRYEKAMLDDWFKSRFAQPRSPTS